jgi:hypothetical protein
LVYLQVEYLAFAKVDMKGREAVLETVEQLVDKWDDSSELSKVEKMDEPLVIYWAIQMVGE